MPSGAVTVGGLVINLAAETSQLKTDMAEGARAVDSGAKAMINAMTGVKESSDRATDAGARMIKQLKDEIATFGMTSQELARHKANLNGVGAEYDVLTQRLNAMRAAQSTFGQDMATTSAAFNAHGAAAREAGGHVEEFGFRTASSKRELLVLAHELSQGNYKKFGGSMLVLAEQTGAAGALFSATGLAALAFGATVVGVSAALIKGGEEQRAMNNALIETGNYAGLTSDSLNALAHAATASGGSIGEAKKAVTDLAGAGKFTAEQIGYISEAAVEMEHVSGKSIEKTIAEFETLAVEVSGNSMRTSETISKATIKLNEQYHFLTESVYEQIRALEKEGDQKGASALAMETLARVTKERTEEMKGNIGSIQHAWQTVKEVIGGVVDQLENMGKRATPAIDVAKFKAQLIEFDKEVAESNARLGRKPDTMSDGLAAARLKIVMNLTTAADALNKVDAAAIEQSKQRAAQDAAVLAASRIEQDNMRLGKKSVSELSDALEKYAQDRAKIKEVNAASPLLDPEEVKRHIALITKAHTEKAPKGQDDRAAILQGELTIAQAGLDREKSIYDARVKMLDLYHTKFGTSDADFYAGRETARAEYLASEAITFAQESALLKDAESRARNPQEVAAAKTRYGELVKAHQKFVDDMRNTAGQDSAGADASAQKQYDDIVKATVGAGAVSIKSLDAQILKQREHNAEIGKTKEQIELAKKAQVDLQTAQLQSDADYLRDGLAKWALDDKSRAVYEIRLANLDGEIARRRTLAGLLDTGADAEAMAKASADLDKYLDPTKAEKFGGALKGALGTASKSMTDLTNAMERYGAQQAANDKARAEAQLLLKGNEKDRAKGLADLDAVNRRGTQQQLAGYGNMAAAAAGFFDEHSKGYQTLMAVSQVFHAAELAMTMAELVPKAISAVLTQGTGDPYTAFGRMAAMAAIVAGLGVAIGGIGGGSDTTAKDRQAAQGSGTVLGDSSAKSASISRAIELSASNSSTQINYLSGMLTSLRAIETNIGSFASQIVQSTDISNPDVHLNTNNGGATTFALGAISAVTGPIGLLVAKIPVLNNLVGKIATSVFGGKQSLSDSGFTMDKTSLAAIIATGAKASQYADIKTSGGWFSSDKNSTQLTSLGADANAQFTLIIKSMADAVGQAGELLGVSGDAFTNQLNSFVVDIGKVSLKGLTGDDLQKALESVFSRLGDQMASYAIGGLTQFQKVGEGYLETLVRVASDYAKVDASLQSIGTTFGAVGVGSIAARENLIALMGGIDQFQSQTASFASDFLTKAEQLAPVSKYVDEQMVALGYAGVTTREQFKNIALSLDKTTDAGQKQFAALMALESAFAATHAATVDLSKTEQEIADERKDWQDQLDQLTMTQTQLLAKQRNALAEVNRPLFDLVQTAQKLADTATNVEKFRDAAKSLNDSLLTGSLSVLTPEQQYAELRDQYQKTKAAALAGDTTAQGAVFNALTAFLTASQKLNSGDTQYQADLAMGQQDSAAMQAWASGQVDSAQAQLNAMNSQADALQSANGMLAAANTILQTIAQNTTPAPIQSGYVLSNALSVLGTTLGTAIKAVQAEVASLRKDQDAQTGDTIAANAEGQQAIVDSVNKGASKTTAIVEKVTLE